MKNKRTKAASLKNTNTQCTMSTSYILIRASVVRSDLARGKARLFIKSGNSYIILDICDLFRAIKIFGRMYHEQVKVVEMGRIGFGT
jgi:hypothetical protein